jgi:hypothetical protein
MLDAAEPAAPARAPPLVSPAASPVREHHACPTVATTTTSHIQKHALQPSPPDRTQTRAMHTVMPTTTHAPSHTHQAARHSTSRQISWA